MLHKPRVIVLLAGIFTVFVLLNFMPMTKAQTSENIRKAELENMLIQDCGSCHGLTMKGGLGPALRPENIVDRDIDYLVNIILEGVPETPMPPWKYLLDRDEALWMVQKLKQGLAP